MGFFSNQLSNVVEWEQFRDDMIFWKWDNKEIKKGSAPKKLRQIQLSAVVTQPSFK